jgi:hypothetical protein
MSSVFEVQNIQMNGNFSWLPNTDFRCFATGNNQDWTVDLTNTSTFTGSTWGVWSDRNSRYILSVRGDTEQVGIGLLAGAATRTLDVGGQARIQAASSCNILTVQTTLNGADQFAGIQLGTPSGQGVALYSRTRANDVTDFGLVTTSGAATSNISVYVSGQNNFTGIGNNNPQFRLDVSGTARVIGTGTPFNGLIIQNTGAGGSPLTSGAAINFRGYNMTTGWSARILSGDGTSGNNGGTLMFSTKTASGTDADTLAEAMRINEVQNVGIGTTTPSSRLHVNGTTRTTNLIVSGNTGYLYANSSLLTSASPVIPMSDISGVLPVTKGGTGTQTSTGTGSVVLSTGASLGRTQYSFGFYPDFFNAAQLHPQTGTTLSVLGHFYGGQMVFGRSDTDANYWRLFGSVNTSFDESFHMRYGTKNGANFTETIPFRFYKGGNATFAGALTHTSDNRVKRDILPYTHGIDKVKQIEPISFYYNGKYNSIDDGTKRIGVVAQDIINVLPDMVSTNRYIDHTTKEMTDVYVVDDKPLLYTLVNAVKEQQQMIEEQSFIITSLQSDIVLMKQQIASILAQQGVANA